KVITKLSSQSNTRICRNLSCDDDNLLPKMELVKQIMESEEHYEIIDLKLVPPGSFGVPLSELVSESNRRIPDPSKRLHHTKKLMRYRSCMHTIIIMRMLGCKHWLETYHKYD